MTARSIFTIAVVAGSTMLLSPSIAFAEVVPGPGVTAYVSHSDLDLTTNSGVKALEGRVWTSIKDVCADVLGTPARPLDSMQCWHSAKHLTRPQIALAVVRSEEFARRGETPPALAVISIPDPRS